MARGSIPGAIGAALLAVLGLAALGAGAVSVALAAGENAPPPGLVVDRVVLLMRHGVRPPTKAQPMPAGVALDAWPSWPVAPGWLTPHGAAAVAALGSADAARYRGRGLLPARGCPAPGRVVAIADSDQRTIATAEAWLGALAPGCGMASEHNTES